MENVYKTELEESTSDQICQTTFIPLWRTSAILFRTDDRIHVEALFNYELEVTHCISLPQNF